MVKYTKYHHGYPTIWSHWMYPPKDVSTSKYIMTAIRGTWAVQKPNFKKTLPVWLSMGFFMWVGYKISFDWGRDSKFNVSLRSDTGNWLYGPPDPKAVHDRHVEHIMHAPQK
ncbi:uncharacterized protein LOC143445807 [Clavelina lepadiformis]|uniref:Uncharacterized protein n=1 Tax=Clavelina lepadiformis TaxID=159417 RepID=A0ABP0FDZ1_CLALP